MLRSRDEMYLLWRCICYEQGTHFEPGPEVRSREETAMTARPRSMHARVMFTSSGWPASNYKISQQIRSAHLLMHARVMFTSSGWPVQDTRGMMNKRQLTRCEVQ